MYIPKKAYFNRLISYNLSIITYIISSLISFSKKYCLKQSNVFVIYFILPIGAIIEHGNRISSELLNVFFKGENTLFYYYKGGNAFNVFFFC